MRLRADIAVTDRAFGPRTDELAVAWLKLLRMLGLRPTEGVDDDLTEDKEAPLLAADAPRGGLANLRTPTHL